MHAFDRLEQRCDELSSRVCAGLDPHPTLLPAGVAGSTEVARWRQYLCAVLEAWADVVPVVKPQIAFFEQLGPDGVALYFEVIREAHRRGMLVIGDIKRSDIGSTAAAYAAAHLGPTDGSAADLVTLNPYLGLDGIRPFLELGRQHGRGVYVLVRTSNPSSAEFQSLQVGGEPLYMTVGRTLEQWGRDALGSQGFTDVGAVVGATHPDEARVLRAALPRTHFLVPGYGAQGGTAQDVAGTFRADGRGAIVNSSRGLLFAGRQDPDGDPVAAARAAAVQMASALEAVRPRDNAGDAARP